ncbi:MAG: hypothetical protein RLZZ248_83 [Bacteroidota bacterium]|jgi:glutaminyl-tRNA synthetase
MEYANFIEQIIKEDIEAGKHEGRVHTRFPPEPNGYLHIGHAKAITVNFGLAQKFGGKTNLRFDDTNPSKENIEYVDSIKNDIKWLGFDWEDREFYASDYFQQLYDFAVNLIEKGLAYVDDSSPEEIENQKGSPAAPGKESPFRNRTIEENLQLFEDMKNGIYEEGSKVLRAKIDMASSNMHLRDPLLYRIRKVPHYRTGADWVIYPMYDFAHGQSDSIEGITHSLCSLEFMHHRPLYNWFIEKLEIFPSRQIEFARMNVTYMITSKRKLLKLVEEKYVKGWDDPRMPTIAGMRRRGFPAEAIRNFCERAGVAKRDNLIEIQLLEYFVRESLNKTALRVMAVLDPIKVVITNYEENLSEELPAQNNPERAEDGTRMIPFSRNLYIEKSDFMEDPPKKFFRLSPGGMVRLKNAYIIVCDHYIKDENSGEVIELHCRYIPESKSGEDTSGLKVKGTIHWVSAPHAINAEVRLYERLFTDPTPDSHENCDFLDFFNEDSLRLLSDAKLEPFLNKSHPNNSYQFLRNGYFTIDKDSHSDKLIFNKTIGLKDNWKPQT